MRFNELREVDIEFIKQTHRDPKWAGNRRGMQQYLAKHFKTTDRSIRNWANELGLMELEVDHTKVLIFDFETSLCLFDTYWPGKQYVPADNMHEDPRIISVAWKWLGDDKVYYDEWDDIPASPNSPYMISGYGDDTALITRFVDVFNEADLVVGVNSDNFDIRIMNYRCLANGLTPPDRFIRSFDLQKGAKKTLRMPSYAMKHMARTTGVKPKDSHEGRDMWRKVQYAKDPEVRREARLGMKKYNIGDILTTEDLFYAMIPYIDHKIHFGTFRGNAKWSCPTCGGTDVEKLRHTTTAAGTVQHSMRCKVDQTNYKISNREYVRFITGK